MASSSRNRKSKGDWAERLAENYLEGIGYRVILRNFRGLRGEIDLIAEHNEVLCFVEVRSRSTTEQGHPVETVNRIKQRRIIRAAEQFLSDHEVVADCRFDVVTVVCKKNEVPNIELIQDAFSTTS